MASKDQAIGGLIFIVCIAVAIGYLIVLVAPGVVAPILGASPQGLQFWAVAVVVLIAFLAIMFIGAWIGWTMATTPPPKPIEELEAEEEKEKEKEEAKVEPTAEPKPEPAAEAKAEPVKEADVKPAEETKSEPPKERKRRK